MTISGLNVGFSGHLIGRPLLDELYARNVRMVRHDCLGVGNAEDLGNIATESLDAGLEVLLVVRPDQCGWLPNVPQIGAIRKEVWNEPDNGCPPTPKMTPEHYAAEVRSACEYQGHPSLWAGVISNLDVDSLEWLKASIKAGWPDGVGVSIHRYPETGFGPEKAHEGFGSREHEIDRLRSVIGNRPWGVSEFGHRLGKQSSKHDVSFTPEQQLAFTRWDFAFFERMGAAYAVAYQINTGEGSERYGWRNRDGAWMPVSEALRT